MKHTLLVKDWLSSFYLYCFPVAVLFAADR